MPLKVTKQTSTDNRQLGMQALKEKRWIEAAGYLTQALKDYPDDTSIMKALAQAHDGLGDSKTARSFLGRAVKTSPDDAEAHKNLALLLIRGGRTLDAADIACRALELDISDDEALRLVTELQGLVRSVKPASAKNGKKQKQAGPTQSDINLRLKRINTALAKAQAVRGLSRPKITLCMIAKDEEAFIAGCLRSVKGTVDEIIVIDTGSEDGTVEIAESYGAKVSRIKWNGSFSEARNAAIEQAGGEWILVLDADEELDPAAKKTIRKAVTKPIADAYELTFYNYREGGKNPDVFTHRTCRLFRNSPLYRYKGRVHEQIVPSIEAAGGKVAKLDAVVHHFGYKPEIMAERNKQERYIRLLEADLKENPDDVHCLYNLGAAYRSADKPEKAVPYLQRAAGIVRPEHEYAALIFSGLSNAFYSLGMAEDALSAAEKAERLGINHPEINFCKGNAFLKMEQYNEAILQFKAAVRHGKSDEWMGDAGALGYKAEYGTAVAYMALGRFEKAAEHCRKVIAEKPDDSKARELLAKAYFNLGKTGDTEKQLLDMLRQDPTDQKAAMDLGDFYYGQSRFRDALTRYMSVLDSGKDTAEIRYRLGLTHYKLEEYEEAESCLLKALEMKTDYYQAYYELGKVYSAQGRAGDSLAAFVKALEVNPVYADAYFGAGELLYSLGKFQDAANAYQNGLSCKPEDAEGFLALGDCYNRMGSTDAAVLAYRQALTLKPDWEEAEERLAA